MTLQDLEKEIANKLDDCMHAYQKVDPAERGYLVGYCHALRDIKQHLFPNEQRPN